MDNTLDDVVVDAVVEEDDYDFEDVEDEYDDIDDSDDSEDIEDIDDSDAESEFDVESGTDSNDIEHDETVQQSPKIDYEQLRQESEKKAYEKGRLEAYIGKKNVYTDKLINDQFDVEVYERMQRIETSGGDPLTDYAEALAVERRTESMAAQENKSAEFNYYDDMQQFKTEHKSVDIGSVVKDPLFEKIAAGRIGKESLSSIYNTYALARDSVTSELSKAKSKMAAKEKASPGALSGTGIEAEISDKETELLFRTALRS